MKRFLLFAGHNYYPSGGWNDFRSDHETAETADEVGHDLISRCVSFGSPAYDWYEVVDTETGRQLPSRRRTY